MIRRRVLALALAAAVMPLAARAAEEKKKGGGLSYIQLGALTATIVRADGRRGVLTVETGIDVPDEKLHARADSLQPRLRAAFVQTLQIYGAGLPPNTAPNLDYLSRELQRETDLVLGKPGGKLLLGTVMVN
jgi:hypothetical protein